MTRQRTLVGPLVEAGVALRRHPRRMGWFGTTALALGGSNQSLFLISALFIGQGDIPGQGSAAIPLLIIGLLLSYAAAPGWTELVLMAPDRVGGIAAACAEAFRPYSPILSTLTGVCYWWGWVPTCGVTAILSATAISQWCLPTVPVPLIACVLVSAFTAVSLCGVRVISCVAGPIAVASATLAFVSMVAPLASGQVDWAQAVSFHLTTPFSGWFGSATSLMAGLYLIGFGAPAFEAATCHVGETIDPARNVPRAMLASAGMAAIYFAVLPVIWLGALGPAAMGEDLGGVLGPTFVPVFGSLAKSAAIGFMMFNMFHGTIQPLAGAARTLSQLAEDGLAPRILSWRSRTDAPWVATLLTAGFAVLFLLIGDPIWLIAAANFTYLIGISLPSIAVWLLRRDAPAAVRPYRAPRGTIGLGLVAALLWGCSALLGFQQFGLPTVVLGLLMAYSGAGLYALRMLENRSRRGLAGLGRSLHVKLTGAMLLVLALDAAGYILAVGAIPDARGAFVVALEDIFVAVALLTISVGIILPGMIAHSADQVSAAAKRLAFGTVRDLALAMDALGEGTLEAAHASVDIVPVVVTSRDELGAMADSFNMLQQSVKQAVMGLDRARQGLSTARTELLDTNAALANTVQQQERLTTELLHAKEAAVFDALHDPLTGLPNRSLVAERLSRMLAQQKDTGASGCAVLFVDLDGFKIVNDSLGHAAGDELLIQVANRLRAQLYRRSGSSSCDLMNETSRNVLGRLGGDEFTVLMAGVRSVEDALTVAGRIKDVLVAPFTIGGQEVHISASIGIATSDGYDLATDILRDADLAMYQAKMLGKGRAEVYDASMLTSATTRLHLENDLRRALRDQEFVLHYQPVVTLPTEEIAGFEALVRWHVPGQGLICPGGFITVAEETGIIVPLGLWVLREACVKARAWNQQFGRSRKLSMSVNISPRQFAQRDLVHDVETVLTETGVDPGLIKLEITESGTMGDPERAVRILSQLRSLGVQLSLDDFGTGYSSLSYLQKFPLDVLKIDQSFVAGMVNNRESRQIVQTIMGLAEGMRMQVVAEGIECRDQLLLLNQLGCDFGQGYLFSKPLPEEAIVKLLTAQPAVDDRMYSNVAPISFKALHVLVVDDVAMNRDIAGSYLRAAGHQVACVGSGAEAIVAIKATDFDVVLMDVRMPEMDGLQATRRIRAFPGARGRVPIVAFTARAFTEQVAECRKAGMDSHAAKPFTPDTLLTAVLHAAGMGPTHGKNVTKPKLTNGWSVPSAAPVVSAIDPLGSDASDAEISSRSEPALPVIGAEWLVLDQATFERTAYLLPPETIETYVRAIVERAEALLAGLRATDPSCRCTDDELAGAAMAIAGSAGLFGFDRLTHLGCCFERAIEMCSANTPALVDGLCAALQDTLSVIHNRKLATTAI